MYIYIYILYYTSYFVLYIYIISSVYITYISILLKSPTTATDDSFQFDLKYKRYIHNWCNSNSWRFIIIIINVCTHYYTYRYTLPGNTKKTTLNKKYKQLLIYFAMVIILYYNMWTNRRPILMSIIKKQRILFLEFCFLGNLTTFQIPIDILKKVSTCAR